MPKFMNIDLLGNLEKIMKINTKGVSQKKCWF